MCIQYKYNFFLLFFSSCLCNPELLFSPSGGMEELTLEQIKKKSELEEDIDFENGENSPFLDVCVYVT